MNDLYFAMLYPFSSTPVLCMTQGHDGSFFHHHRNIPRPRRVDRAQAVTGRGKTVGIFVHP